MPIQRKFMVLADASIEIVLCFNSRAIFISNSAFYEHFVFPNTNKSSYILGDSLQSYLSNF